MTRLIFIFFCVLAGVGLFFVPVHALTIAPALTEIELDPGSSIEREVTVFNESSAPITVSARIESFVPKGDRGATEVVNDAHQALRWIQLGQTVVTLAPGTAQTIPVLISVPKTAAVGGYYVALMWQQSSSGTSGVTLNSRVGSLLLLTVRGEVKRSLVINDVAVVDSGITKPLRFDVSIENTGNVHIKPSGMIVIKNIFNRVVATVPINATSGNILPQSTRVFEAQWPHKRMTLIDGIKRLAMVRASVYAEVSYDDATKLVSNEQQIWTIPFPTVIGSVILVGLIFCFALILMRRNKQKRT